MGEGTALEVWGDPVAHSRSPQLHAAAYRVLGLPWSYGRRRVDEAGFAAALADARSAGLRGLSLTMPLKGAAYAAAATHDDRAAATGAVNTLLLTGDKPRGVNTDVGGIVRALREAGIDTPGRARIVGAGATATSALVALAELGAEHVAVAARRPAAVEPLKTLGDRLGIAVQAEPLSDEPYATAPVTVATLPGDATVAASTVDALAGAGGLLMDVVYGHWPTALSQAWERAGHPAVSGEGMLLHQALLQVRVFVGGDADAALPDETEVLAAMRRALVGG
ncbi:shikimate dehydrogenase [Microbacterium sp. zg.Y1090]|uniref:shikimate dehydrogenase family protein n=1 Tax=Microbacterium TaxID=33882 RepID=UPI00214B3013|nr:MULTISPECIES: shikimate dehydrogenase [unclassified Microbacterium]MCR2811889.1 shikimate dehydrogenase [Microbacterium sp. zg.Y1084]MCR2818672.1 shikimate dehydrogenase [Microbacterium sp. zg.Y1090]MDL5486485.1 shikimate dehydrogenase [Microbacterium sp. zg-Y1211]WIM29669.1 shikimate dehydrogenase [Microbacterium sp. zg-Y1090]